MKKIVYGILPLVALFLTGCATSSGKIEKLESRIETLETKCGVAVSEETAAPASMEEVAAPASEAQVAAPETPTKKDIQATLKNAGFYEGTVDGKFGPKTKKAVEDFQAANELKVDGKVGPNTWEKLKKYYVAPEAK